MFRVQIAKRKAIYKKIRSISEEIAARVMVYIRSLQEEEPALPDDEEEGIHITNAGLSRGEKRSFKEAFMDLW